MGFSYYSWQDYTDTNKSTGSCIIFYQGGTIDNFTHVPVPVDQSSAEIKYNVACSSGISLEHFRMLIHELLKKDPDIVSDKAPLIIFDRKYDVWVAENGRDNKHTRHIKRVHFWEIARN